MLKKEARQITGGLSKPSKMPGPAHNLPAWNCITGQKLVNKPDLMVRLPVTVDHIRDLKIPRSVRRLRVN